MGNRVLALLVALDGQKAVEGNLKAAPGVDLEEPNAIKLACSLRDSNILRRSDVWHLARACGFGDVEFVNKYTCRVVLSQIIVRARIALPGYFANFEQATINGQKTQVHPFRWFDHLNKEIDEYKQFIL